MYVQLEWRLRTSYFDWSDLSNEKQYRMCLFHIHSVWGLTELFEVWNMKIM